MNINEIKPLENLIDKVRDNDGFPIADDRDILELSDPPYYTACPNPYINDFLKKIGKAFDPENDNYEIKPFVSDVSEGKNDPIYRAHSYHTKVPHKAIIKFIEHYTELGDIVFDGFCGSGMTGIAASMTGRRAVLADLSPAAAFIAYNYNHPVCPEELAGEAYRILKEVEDECGWMYETNHRKRQVALLSKGSDKSSFGQNIEKGVINYVIWSDIFICPYCHNEYIFWDVAIDHEKRKVLKKYNCPNCKTEISKKGSIRAEKTIIDPATGKKIKQAKQTPVLVNYSYGGKRYDKRPDRDDLKLLDKIESMEIPYWYPANELPRGHNTKQPKRSHGFSHSHHFYTRRNLWVLAALFSRIRKSNYSNKLLYLFTAIRMLTSKNTKVQVNKFFKGGQFFSYVTGTLYIASANIEGNVINSFSNRIKAVVKLYSKLIRYDTDVLVSTSSISNTQIMDNMIDYIFTDPPFGNNLIYSELNFLWESWLKVFTNNETEAIINDIQNKGLKEYTELMTRGFKEMYRILKPNRWMTVVFHNSKASVWNAIQQSITRAGFIIAQVSLLDKKQGSFKQVTAPGSVKNDLVINAYKPDQEFEESFLKKAGEGMEVDFIKQQLGHLPVGPNIERTEKMLYSRMLAHYVEKGFKIRYDASQFYRLLHKHFVKLDGYWYLKDQVKDRKGDLGE